MRLYLIRHEEAQPVGGEIKSDAERPLSDRGVRRLKLIAQALNKLGCRPVVVYHSPLLRARQTADLLAAELQPQRGTLDAAELDSGQATAESIASLFAGTSFDEAAIVGHQPDFGAAAAALLGAPQPVAFSKGTVCCLDFEGRPKPGRAELAWHIPRQAVEVKLT